MEAGARGRGRFGQCLCACMMAHGAGRYERFIAGRKRRLLGGVGDGGTVLEIGAGTGVNIPYLPRSMARYIAVEPNPYMHPHLLKMAREHSAAVDLRDRPFEEIQIPDASVDAVVCTLVLCSVADPALVLERIGRMLRPGGRFIFIEHIAAPPGTWLRAVQRSIRPLWRRLGDGCHPDRETANLIEERSDSGSGCFASLNLERFRAPLPMVSPHIAGTARTAWKETVQ
jgi:ubiquinone/menaquinone biosynthesis C-methylase UbiE